MGVLSWLPEGIKQDLGWDSRSAALEEMGQGKYRGYNPTDGTINRGFWEGIRDGALGNDPAEIQRITRELQVENIKDTLGKRITKTNQGLTEVGATDRLIKPEYTDTIEGIRSDLDTADAKIPVVAQGQDAAPDAGITMDTPVPQITRATRGGQRTEENLAILESPIYQQQLKDAATARADADRRFNATQQLAITQMGIAQQQQANQMQIAQMNNQLQMRRQDSADRRADRRDRQAMIQQLMGGLSALGTSIAV